MTKITAVSFVCDDMLTNVTGKLTISGMYTSDIIIAEEPTFIAQLVILFAIVSPLEFKFLPRTLEVSIPGEIGSRNLPIPVPAKLPIVPGRTTMTFRIPFVLQNIALRSGKIETKVSYECGEVSAGGHWISTLEQMQEIQKQIIFQSP